MNVRTMPLYPRAVFWFVLLLLTALLGFSGTYFMRLAENNLVRHLHAATAFAWLLLLIAQAWLMRRRNFALHRKLGRSSLALAPLFVVTGLFLVQDMLARPGPFIKPYAERLAFVDLVTLAWFAAAYLLALRHRRETPLHARYLASTALLVLPPALVRAVGMFVPGVTSFDMAFHLGTFVAEALVVGLMVHDLRSEGRVRPPYPLLLAATVIGHVGFVVLPGVLVWSRFCAWYAALL